MAKRNFRHARKRRDGTPIRCNPRCYPQSHSTLVIDGTGAQRMTYCRVCKWAMSALELMRPRLEVVKSDSGFHQRRIG